jgi:hypothetical protein
LKFLSDLGDIYILLVHWEISESIRKNLHQLLTFIF